jgi:hypothetical protein
MQDPQEGGRYVIQAFDAFTWSIIDTYFGRVYVLALNELSNLIVHLSLTEVATNTESSKYLMYLREIMSCSLGVSSVDVAKQLAQQVLDKLLDCDIDNPVELAFLLSADLHGQSAVGHNERAH